MRPARMSVLDSPPEVEGHDMTYEISDLRTLESEAIHVIREVAAESFPPENSSTPRPGSAATSRMTWIASDSSVRRSEIS